MDIIEKINVFTIKKVNIIRNIRFVLCNRYFIESVKRFIKISSFIFDKIRIAVKSMEKVWIPKKITGIEAPVKNNEVLLGQRQGIGRIVPRKYSFEIFTT
ncbi:hypothetical protein NSB27_01435 [Murimonas intestini]|nr:hypothetical protein [Murimonas intestini]